MTWHLLLFATLFVASTATRAAEVVIYRCTDAAGGVSLQDTPCDRTQREERRVLRVPRGSSPPLPAPAPTTPASPAPVDGIVRDAPPPRRPQPLFVCERHDGIEYESDTGMPERRWVPLWALGADPRATGTALDPSTIGRTSPLRRTARDGVPALGVSAMTLGTWVEDVCTPLSAAQICARRRDALAGYGRRIFNAGQSEADRLRAEQASLRARIRAECDG